MDQDILNKRIAVAEILDFFRIRDQGACASLPGDPPLSDCRGDYDGDQWCGLLDLHQFIEDGECAGNDCRMGNCSSVCFFCEQDLGV